MAPSVTEAPAQAAQAVQDTVSKLKTTESQPEAQVPELASRDDELPDVRTGHREPVKLSGALDQFEYFETTPVIGREYVNVDLVQLLRAPNSDDLLRDLALTISQRGVVFFRQQDDVTNDIQKELLQRLGELSGKPATSKLHIHPVYNAARGDDKDNEISVISSARRKEHDPKRFGNTYLKQSAKSEWHSDITFEPIPSDYTLLRLTQLPKTGGDTLWASGYELYDRISPPLQKLFESLTATYAQPGFNRVAERNKFTLYSNERGAPENVGDVLEAIHPVIRTNPVSGWKSVFAVGHHVQKINGLSEDESKHFLNWFSQLIVENHDLQVRHRWRNVNDLAIWDNRSVYHAATPDYVDDDLGERKGSRTVGLGERPYFDPQSTSRRQALRAQRIASAKSE